MKIWVFVNFGLPEMPTLLFQQFLKGHSYIIVQINIWKDFYLDFGHCTYLLIIVIVDNSTNVTSIVKKNEKKVGLQGVQKR